MKNLTRIITLLLFLTFILDGCYFEKKFKEDFVQVENLNSLNGTYRNLGKVAPSSIRTIYLSRIIWPNDENLEHQSIDEIEVENITDEILAVRAIQRGTVVKQVNFVEGKDFEFAKGRVKLPTKIEWSSLGPGSSVESIELGIDSSGHGKGRESFSGAVLAYFIYPIAVRAVEEVRFEKISNYDKSH